MTIWCVRQCEKSWLRPYPGQAHRTTLCYCRVAQLSQSFNHLQVLLCYLILLSCLQTRTILFTDRERWLTELNTMLNKLLILYNQPKAIPKKLSSTKVKRGGWVLYLQLNLIKLHTRNVHFDFVLDTEHNVVTNIHIVLRLSFSTKVTLDSAIISTPCSHYPNTLSCHILLLRSLIVLRTLDF